MEKNLCNDFPDLGVRKGLAHRVGLVGSGLLIPDGLEEGGAITQVWVSLGKNNLGSMLSYIQVNIVH